jgi:hypothetical protein
MASAPLPILSFIDGVIAGAFRRRAWGEGFGATSNMLPISTAPPIKTAHRLASIRFVQLHRQGEVQRAASADCNGIF